MKIVFEPNAYHKMNSYIHGIGYEISGFGKIEKREKDIWITDVKIFQQVVTGGNTIIDAMAVAKFFDDLEVAGEDASTWKLWWHSHVYMSALFSGTDTATIEEFDSEMPADNWMLSIVANKYQRAFAQIDIYEPIRCSISDIPWSVAVGEVTWKDDVQAEIKEKVTIRTKELAQSGDRIFWGKKPNERSFSVEEREKLRQQFPLLYASLFPNLPLAPVSQILEGEIVFGEKK